jgi:peptidylprolyl isomerase
LYANHCPKTVENFKKICTGQNKAELTYKGNIFDQIISGYMAQGGNIVHHDNPGIKSIYYDTFKDENLNLAHYKRGLISMANDGPDSNGSRFLITLVDTPWLNGHHCVFGELVQGEEVLEKIEGVGSRDGKPKEQIKIEDCGEVKN